MTKHPLPESPRPRFDPATYPFLTRARWRYGKNTKTITVSPELAARLEAAGLVRGYVQPPDTAA